MLLACALLKYRWQGEAIFQVVILRYHGSLNENGSHKLIGSSACGPVDGIVWEGLGSMVLMEKVTRCRLQLSKSPCHSQLVLTASCLWIKM